MLNRKSIKTQFIVIFTAIILTSIIATIVTYFVGFIIFTSIEYKKIYPANYYEKKIPDIENYIRRKGESLLNIKEKSNIEKIIPSQGITYQIIDQNGDILYGTESQKFINNKEDLYKKINTNQGLNGRYVHIVPIIDKHGKIAGAVLLYYKLVPYYQSTTIKLIFTVILLSPFLYIIFFTILFSKKFVRDIKKPIDMLIEASEKIKQKNLDFNIDYKAKNEFGSLCEAFDDMKNELKRSLISQWKLEQQRHDMVEALAHDLKTPLSIIQGYTESLLESNLNDKEKLERYLNVIKNSTFRALQMIKEMLYTAEIESYNLSLEVVPIDINSFIQQKVESYKIISKSKNIDFKVKIFDVMPDKKTYKLQY
ncbi:HAMP domain-containing protein [Thermoanaerobacter thermohydrosulfuricus]|uniref:histidine kinase n=1 Tax=Thermoanaerobacter thermohydrosulfuricus TaxID=1516 RepID=A0A1G7W2U4_THETY|nr:HAMP domain-containing sensor histidine kinase [Thermoanaerobacter thermohydrosulfuricus]SDG66273.1 HAMP domain-containing protein [Thermoanaerobacter thermohydrosulfuricus]